MDACQVWQTLHTAKSLDPWGSALAFRQRQVEAICASLWYAVGPNCGVFRAGSGCGAGVPLSDIMFVICASLIKVYTGAALSAGFLTTTLHMVLAANYYRFALLDILAVVSGCSGSFAASAGPHRSEPDSRRLQECIVAILHSIMGTHMWKSSPVPPTPHHLLRPVCSGSRITPVAADHSASLAETY